MILNIIVLTFVLLFQQATPAQPESAISGRVSYADGTPYTRALLIAQPMTETGTGGNPAQPSSFTSNTGDFRFRNVSPGRYVIRTADSTAYYPGVTTAAAAIAVTVTAASVSENINFVLPSALTGFRVSGRVIRSPGQPQAATQVMSFSGTQRISGDVAADGTFELLHVRAGIYSFQVLSAIGMRPVSVAVDRDISGLELAMPRLFDIAGTFTVEGRATLSGLFNTQNGPLFALTFDGPGQFGSAVEANGSFRAAVLEGEYRIHADRLPPGYYIKALTSGERDLLTNRLQIAASDKPVQIALTLAPSPGVKVSGKVTGVTGGASTLTLIGTVVTNGYEAAIQPDGSFAVSPVMPGAYVARVTSSASVASPPVSVLIPNRDVADLKIAIPPPVSVSGRVTVDGSGPPPKFTLLLAHGSVSSWNSMLDNEGIATLQQEARTGGIQLIKVDVDALPDGSFKLQLPEGEYHVATQRTSIPSPYVLTSISYAGTNLLVDPLSISEKESSEILVGFGTTSQNPWSRVSGRVVGFESSQGPLRVSLEGDTTSTMETPVNADGTFEFSRVLQNNRYTAKLLPENKMASSPRVSVGAKDVDKVEIVIPREREIMLRTTVEGGGPVPSYVISLAGSSSTVSVLVKPDLSGIARIKLPEDDRKVSLDSLPLGYIVKSVTLGPTDFQVTFANDPAIPFGKISGRVTGLSSEATDVRLILSDAATFSTFEQAVGGGGSFAFSSLPQGTYVPSLAGAQSGKSGQSALLSPSLINVNGTDTSGIAIAVPNGSSRQDTQPDVTDAPVGARVSEFGGTSRTAAREAAAVATLRTITTAEVTFLSTNKGNFGTMSQMIDAGLLPENFRGIVNGFNYGVISVGSDFVAAAIPTDSGSARNGFYITPDGVVRYSTIESLAPAGRNGAPVN